MKEEAEADVYPKRLRKRRGKKRVDGMSTADVTNIHWYGLAVRAGSEFPVEAALEARGLVAIAPQYRVWRRVNRYVQRKYLETFPVMPRYVFVGFPPPWPSATDEAVELHAICRDITLVQGVLGSGARPLRMIGKHVADLLVRCGDMVAPDEQRHMRTHHEFGAGQEAMIIGGPFAGRIVEVAEINGEIATVLLPLFGAVHEQSIPLAKLDGAH